MVWSADGAVGGVEPVLESDVLVARRSIISTPRFSSALNLNSWSSLSRCLRSLIRTSSFWLNWFFAASRASLTGFQKLIPTNFSQCKVSENQPGHQLAFL